MIIKTFEISKFTLQNKNLYLFYGENEGFKNEIIEKDFKKKYQNKIYKYEEKEILEKKSEFFNSLLTKSFFESEKLIIITRASDKIKGVIEEIIEKNIIDITIILLANVLDKKSKLRDFFEKDKNLICIPFYQDNNQTLNLISKKFFNEKKIPISQELINLLVERCRGNRGNLNNELNKIENFCKYGKKINIEEILKLTNLSENYSVSELTDNCLAKNIKKTVHILNENNFSPEDCILIIRTLLHKTKRLLKIQQEINIHKNMEKAVLNFRPPIFWKDKEIVKKQINEWSIKQSKNMVFNINKIELLIKKNSSNSLNILSDFILMNSKKINN